MRRTRSWSPAAAACLVALLAPTSATALPAFARKTGLACSACHEVWPRLNDFGQSFRDRGYRLEGGRDAPIEQSSAYWPLAMRTTVGYQWLRQTLVPVNGGTTTTQTGALGFTGLDVLSGGTLSDKVSYLLTYTPGLGGAGFGQAPQDGNLESAWVGIHDIGGTPWVNVRVGKHALDLPVDEHRSITLTQGYNAYHFHPQGTATTFEAGENQSGVELYGHSDYSRVRYSVSVINQNGAALSDNVLSTPAAWGHVQGTQYLDSDVLAAVKGGVFGMAGWQPTQFALLTPPGGAPTPVNGTGFSSKPYHRYGAELQLTFLSRVYPLTVSGVVMAGDDDAALVPGGVRSAQFVGGWGEVTWTPSLRWTAIARYEQLNNTQAATDANPVGTGNLTAVTAALRHTVELTSRTELAFHLEVSRSAVQAADGTVPDVTTGLAGFDFAF